jgi:transcriptional regulator with XRE-family HTH domain
MKLDRPKDWYERRIALEGNLEVGAGVPPGYPARVAAETTAKPVDTRIAFGTFVELWRRNRGWDAVKLAEEAGVTPEEVLEIERYPQSEPEPSAVYKLAQVFEVPAKILLELAGLVAPRTPNLRQAAVRFAARTESMAALNEHEREALEAFIAAITETTSNHK